MSTHTQNVNTQRLQLGVSFFLAPARGLPPPPAERDTPPLQGLTALPPLPQKQTELNLKRTHYLNPLQFFFFFFFSTASTPAEANRTEP